MEVIVTSCNRVSLSHLVTQLVTPILPQYQHYVDKFIYCKNGFCNLGAPCKSNLLDRPEKKVNPVLKLPAEEKLMQFVRRSTQPDGCVPPERLKAGQQNQQCQYKKAAASSGYNSLLHVTISCMKLIILVV